MKLLDLFAGAGGAGVGYARAGFDVIAVDTDRAALAHNPHPWINADALTTMRRLLRGETVTAWQAGERPIHLELGDFHAIHASPPCQRWSTATAYADRHPDLITPLRPLLEATGLPYVIENVPQAPLVDPVRLCGSMFGLGVRRHRHFEAGHHTITAPRCDHAHQGRPVGVYGDHPDGRRHYRPDGTERGTKATSLEHAQAAMGIDWMPWRHLKESIPPAYSEHIGRQFVEHLAVNA